MTTNGTLLSEEMCRHLVDIGWDRLGVSLDGPDAAGHDAGRGREGVFEEAVAGIRRLEAEKERQGALLPVVTVVSILHRDNVDRIEEFLELMADLAPSQIYFQPMTQQSRVARDLMFVPDDLPRVRELLARASRRGTALGLRTNAEELSHGELIEEAANLERILAHDVACLEPGFLQSGCLVPWDQLVLMGDGKVQPCWRHQPEGVQGIGEASIEEIWHGPAMQRARARMEAGEFPSACSGCCMAVVEENRSLRLAALHDRGEVGPLVRLFCHVLDLQDSRRELLEPVFRTLLEQARDGIPSDCWPEGPVAPPLASPIPDLGGASLREVMAGDGPDGPAVIRALRAFGGLCERLNEPMLTWGVALALPLDTSDPQEIWRRASALEKTGRYEEALGLLDGLEERAPTLAAAVFDTRGVILCRRGDTLAAAHWLRAALRMEPLRVETTCALSYALFLIGERAQAVELVQRLQDRSPNAVAGFLLELYADRIDESTTLAPVGPARMTRGSDGGWISYSFLDEAHAGSLCARMGHLRV